MRAGSSNQVLQGLRRAVLLENGGGLSDGQLLEGFVRQRDEVAFEALVRRHGPMVLGVCRRVIGHEPDAEDAFQAAFLVLVRRAASIVPREKVGNWLYGVAYRTALEARKAMLRRRNKEKPLNNALDPETESKAEKQDLAELLYRELSRLPDKYRLPMVLCELEGRSRKEVAQQLHLPEGTLSSRLAMARKMLAKRLTCRGISFSAGGLAVALSRPGATTGMPPSLVSGTVHMAIKVIEGLVPTSALVSANVLSLTHGVSKAMLLAKLKVTTVVILLALTAGLGAGLMSLQGLADEPTSRAKQDSLEPAAKAEKPPPDKDELQGTWMLMAREEDGKRQEFPQGVGITVTFDKGKMTTREEPLGLFARGAGNSTQGAYTLRPSEDLKEIDLAYLDGPKKGQPWKRGIYLLEGNQLKICWGDEENRPSEFATAGDSKLVLNVFRRMSPGQSYAERPAEKWLLRLNLDTKHEEPVSSAAFSPDGKLLATGSIDKTVKLWNMASGKEIGMLRMSGDFPVTYLEFSPDGRTIAAVGTDVDERKPGRVSVHDADNFKLRFYTNGHGGQINSIAFSPDGRLLATAGRDKTVSLFDAARGVLRRQITGHNGPVNSVKFSPDGKILASASSDGTVRLWDPASGKEIRRLQVIGGADGISHRRGGVRTVKFTSDGKWIVTVGEDAMNLWEASSGKQILEWYGQNGGVVIAEVSPDGKTLAVTERKAEQTVVLWDIEPMKKLATLSGRMDPVKSIALSPDGKTLAITGEGTHIKLWTREVRKGDSK